MRTYIINLTNQLIGKHAFDRLDRMNCDQFIFHVKSVLELVDVHDMKPETLGKVMCSFEHGDVPTSKEGLFRHITYGGDCTRVLRELVAFCLARAIYERLTAESEMGDIPAYRRRARQFA